MHCLILRRCVGVTDVSALDGVHTLDLCGCAGVTDAGALETVRTLNIKSGGVLNIDILGSSVKSLRY